MSEGLTYNLALKLFYIYSVLLMELKKINLLFTMVNVGFKFIKSVPCNNFSMSIIVVKN